MAKITAWLVTLAGVLLILPALGVSSLAAVSAKWLLPLIVLIIGLTKLARNYKMMK